MISETDVMQKKGDNFFNYTIIFKKNENYGISLWQFAKKKKLRAKRLAK